MPLIVAKGMGILSAVAQPPADGGKNYSEKRPMYGDDSWLDTAGRLLIVAGFLATGACNLTAARVKDHIERMTAFGTPAPAAVFWIGIALQFTGCALILLDWRADIGVGCLIVFTVAATAIFHRFWTMQDPVKRNGSRITLLGNTAIVGGLLLLLGNVR
jgi:uncharacterized membrane protein YphA (DoxX/SURF4 family)